MIILLIIKLICSWQGLTASGASKSAAKERKSSKSLWFDKCSKLAVTIGGFVVFSSASMLQTVEKDTVQVKAILLAILVVCAGVHAWCV